MEDIAAGPQQRPRYKSTRSRLNVFRKRPMSKCERERWVSYITEAAYKWIKNQLWLPFSHPHPSSQACPSAGVVARASSTIGSDFTFAGDENETSRLVKEPVEKAVEWFDSNIASLGRAKTKTDVTKFEGAAVTTTTAV